MEQDQKESPSRFLEAKQRKDESWKRRIIMKGDKEEKGNIAYMDDELKGQDSSEIQFWKVPDVVKGGQGIGWALGWIELDG